jgi:threonine dehydrogenase-like Zn-dependent dehydrogenase
MRTMKAAVFVEPDRIVLDEKPVPEVGPGDALVRITTTTICGTDVHILNGEYPVERGRIIGHEPVGMVEELGPGVTGYEVGQRVIIGATASAGSSLTMPRRSPAAKLVAEERAKTGVELAAAKVTVPTFDPFFWTSSTVSAVAAILA